MKTTVILISLAFVSCANFNPSADQIDATTQFVRAVADLHSGK